MPYAGAVTIAPVQPSERSPLPDILRGLALLGILVVNAQDFAGIAVWQQLGLDRWAQVITDIFFNGRWISVFAMLFGWGAAGMAARHGGGRLLRRLLVLFLIGCLHFVVVWYGDIIANYALIGLVLLLTARLKVRQLLIAAAVSGGWWLWSMGLYSMSYWHHDPMSEVLRQLDGPSMPYGDGYAALVGARVDILDVDLLSNTLFNGPWLLMLMLLGAAAQRSGVFNTPQQHGALWHKLKAWGLMLGLPMGVWLAYLNTLPSANADMLAIPVRMLGGALTAAGYVGLVAEWVVAGQAGGLRPFQASGRVAMSNYLTQSLVMTTLFYPYGLGWRGHLGAAGALTVALVLGLLQLPLSALWLRRFAFGPVEALVRWAVYGKFR